MPRSSSQSWHLSALRGPVPDPLRGSESGRQEALPQSQKVQSRLAHLKCWLTQAVLTGLEVYISLLVLFQMNLRLLSQTQASLLHIAPIPARSKKNTSFHRDQQPERAVGDGEQTKSSLRKASESFLGINRRTSAPPPERTRDMVVLTTRRWILAPPQCPECPASLQEGQRFP